MSDTQVPSGKNAAPLVMIEWEDSCAGSLQWEDLDGEFPLEPMVCLSVGSSTTVQSVCKVVIPHVSKSQPMGLPRQACGDVTIPSRSIRKIHYLKQTEERTEHHGQRKAERATERRALRQLPPTSRPHLST